MRLVKLSFANINALAGEWTIDFTDPVYRENGLFAIVGPTGSGKSSILDAVTLALYGKTPRMSEVSTQNKDDDLRCPVMTKGTTSCRAAVRFDVDGKEYMSLFKQQYTRTGKLRDAQVELVAFAGPDDEVGTVLTTKKTEWYRLINEITHMNFDVFTRSVLLAQGRFAEFLKADEDSRAVVLEKITGTTIYSTLGQWIFDKTKHEAQALEAMKSAQSALALLAPDERGALEAENQAVREAVEQTRGELAAAQKRARELEALAAAQTRAASLAASHDKAQRALDALKPLSEKARTARAAQPAVKALGQYVKAQQATRAADTALGEIDRAMPAADKRALRANADAQKADQDYEAAAKAVTAFEPDYRAMVAADNDIAAKKTRAAADEALLGKRTQQATAAAAQLTAARTACDAARAAHEKNQAKLQATENDDKLEAAAQLIQKHVSSVNDAWERCKKEQKVLTAARAALEAAETTCRGGQEKLSQSREAAQKADEDHKAKLEALMLVQKDQSLESVLKDVTQNRQAYYALATYRRAREHAADTAHLLQAVGDDAPGEAAGQWFTQTVVPLITGTYETQLDAACRAAQGFFPAGTDLKGDSLSRLARRQSDLDSVLDALCRWAGKAQTAQTMVQKAAEQAQSLREAARTLEASVRRDDEALLSAKTAALAADTAHTRARDLFTDARARMHEAIGEVSDKPCENGAQINALIDALNARYQERSGIKAAAADAAAVWEKAAQGFARAEQDDAHARREAQSAQGAAAASAEALKTALEKRRRDYGNKDPEALMSALKRERDKCEQTRRVSQNEREKANEALLSLKSRRTAEARAQKQNGDYEALAKAEFDRLFAASGFSDVNDLQQACMDEEAIARIEADRQALEAKCQQQAGALSEAREALAALTKTVSVKENADELAALIQTLDKKRAAGQLRLGELKAILARDDKARDAYAEQARAVAARTQVYEGWQRLNALIGSADGKKFRNMAQRVTFGLLLAEANRVMQTMTQRYTLFASGVRGLSVDVVDHDIGSVPRTSQNLSGGETFLVSLALALALSRMGGENLSVDTLFLDEGFGALDASTLDKALYALETLRRTSGKLIGVISHVQAVSERFGTHIRLTPEAGSGHSRLSGPGVSAG